MTVKLVLFTLQLGVPCRDTPRREQLVLRGLILYYDLQYNTRARYYTLEQLDTVAIIT